MISSVLGTKYSVEMCVVNLFWIKISSYKMSIDMKKHVKYGN